MKKGLIVTCVQMTLGGVFLLICDTLEKCYVWGHLDKCGSLATNTGCFPSSSGQIEQLRLEIFLHICKKFSRIDSGISFYVFVYLFIYHFHAAVQL